MKIILACLTPVVIMLFSGCATTSIPTLDDIYAKAVEQYDPDGEWSQFIDSDKKVYIVIVRDPVELQVP